MQLLSLLLVASPVLVLGMRRSEHDCGIEDPVYLGIRECLDITRPPLMLKTAKLCIKSHTSKAEFRDFRQIRGDKWGKSLCFLAKYNNLTTEQQGSISTCVFNEESTDFTLDGFRDGIANKIEELSDTDKKNSLRTAFNETCTQPTADIASIMSFTGCLMQNCARYVYNSVALS